VKLCCSDNTAGEVLWKDSSAPAYQKLYNTKIQPKEHSISNKKTTKFYVSFISLKYIKELFIIYSEINSVMHIISLIQIIILTEKNIDELFPDDNN
jgi:hypothetical protein